MIKKLGTNTAHKYVRKKSDVEDVANKKRINIRLISHGEKIVSKVYNNTLLINVRSVFRTIGRHNKDREN